MTAGPFRPFLCGMTYRLNIIRSIERFIEKQVDLVVTVAQEAP